MRWTDRLLGLVSTMVLARLLVPADFGLVAMAMVVVGLLDVLLDLGVGAALIQNTRADADDFHTAWTLRLLQSTVAAVLLVISAPFAADYYHDERVTAILRVVAITAFIGGLENIGTVSFQKNMEFGRDFRFFFSRRVIGVIAGIVAALILRSYWALVLGTLISRLASVLISYQMSAFRPKFSFGRFTNIWAFSQWNLLAATGYYLASSIGRFVVGGRASAAATGAYAVGEEIALMPTTELLAPLGRVMFPVFASCKHDNAELLRVVALALAVQALIAVPAGVGVALVAPDAIAVLLGKQWSAAAPITEVIAVASVATALGHSAVYMLTALGKMKTVAAFSWAKVIILFALVAVVFRSPDPRDIAFAFLITSYGGLVVVQLLARKAVPGFGGRLVVRHVWRPLLATALMAGAVASLGPVLVEARHLVRLAAEVLTGAAAYTIATLVLWRISGSPDGAETYILAKVRPQLTDVSSGPG